MLVQQQGTAHMSRLQVPGIGKPYRHHGSAFGTSGRKQRASGPKWPARGRPHSRRLSGPAPERKRRSCGHGSRRLARYAPRKSVQASRAVLHFRRSAMHLSLLLRKSAAKSAANELGF